MGWFIDLEKALKVFRDNKPEIETFDSIECNLYGDFVIKTNKEKYIIIHNSLKIYVFNEKECRWEVVV